MEKTYKQESFTLTLSLPKFLLKEIEALAKAETRTRSAMAKLLIVRGIKSMVLPNEKDS